MSVGSPKLARREEAIEATRRRLRRLEIETHRIKAELARLEAEYEDDVADRLTRKLRRQASAADATASVSTTPVSDDGSEPTVIRFDRASTPAVSVPSDKRTVPATTAPTELKKSRKSSDGRRPAPTLPRIDIDSSHATTAGRGRKRRVVASYRKAAPPLACSMVVHAVALSLCVTLTIATIAQQQAPLLASPSNIDEIAAEEFSEVEIEPAKFDDPELQNIVQENQDFNIADNLAREFEPAELGAGSQALGDIGQLDALPSELGTLMAGAGEPGGGQPGGRLGSAVFFGTRSKGDRFVFVVDNSSSMKGGRLDAAIAELVNTVETLSPRQTFYVIFVSDQPYPMFYPEPAANLLSATAPNKKRLAEWLPNAILASGNNRQLIKAMDMAAELRPHAVFLLWDGDLKYSEKVRTDVMTHLTRPNQWDFTIHTLGMGVSSLANQQNLAAIAAAHGGTFRRVDLPTARKR